MREIILDTETTGLDPSKGDRIVEIACVEIFNSIPTGENFHRYVDPQRDVPVEAFQVHGLSTEFLKGKPLFADIVSEFLEFVGDSPLVIHNAEFDMRFINAELKRINLEPFSRNKVIDTLQLARRKHPGSPNSLDALCARYRIDNSRRTKHGALLDSEILCEVYAELCGGRQTSLGLVDVRPRPAEAVEFRVTTRAQLIGPSIEVGEIATHAKFIETLGEKAVWNRYIRTSES